MVIESMQIPINRGNNLKFSRLNYEDRRNSVSVVAAVMAIIPFKGNDVLVRPWMIGIDDQVNTDSEGWSPTSNISNLVVLLWLRT